MKAFAKAFYESAAWRRTRAYILKRDAGLCVHCGERALGSDAGAERHLELPDEGRRTRGSRI